MLFCRMRLATRPGIMVQEGEGAADRPCFRAAGRLPAGRACIVAWCERQVAHFPFDLITHSLRFSAAALCDCRLRTVSSFFLLPFNSCLIQSFDVRSCRLIGNRTIVTTWHPRRYGSPSISAEPDFGCCDSTHCLLLSTEVLLS